MKITSDLYQDIDGEASCSTEASFGDGSRGEVKQLQDSLTAFFTPSNRRRSRVAQSSFSLDQIIETTNMVCRVSNGTGVKAKVTGDLSENRRQSAFESHDTMKTRNIASTSTSDVKEILDNVDVHHNGCPKPKMCVMRPLTVITDDDEEASLHSRRSTCPLTSSRNTVPFSSFRASNVLSPPHRKTDKLYDSLSPYYSPKSSEKRRTVCKGEYAQLSGIRTRVRSGGSSSAQEQLSPPALSVVEQARRNEDHSSIGSTSQEERSDSEKLADDEKCITRSKVKKTHSNVNMSNRIRVAEKSTKRTKSPLTLHSFFKSSQPQNSLPVPETTHTSATSHIIDAAHTVSPRRSKLISNSSSGARFQSHRSVSVNLVRKAKARKAGLKTQCERSRTNCYKRSKLTELPRNQRTLNFATSTNPGKRKLAVCSGPLKSRSINEAIATVDLSDNDEDFSLLQPPEITSLDKEPFDQAQQIVRKQMAERRLIDKEEGSPNSIPRHPACIRIGKYEIETWFSAPYPEEYACLPVLFLCEFCIQRMRSADVGKRHQAKCQLRSPPGDEIYRNGDISVFEVDGFVSKEYCINICLLGKLFLDHKTLYFDVEPFLFYVLTKNDRTGCHFVGYFSKEKYSAQKYNLSCIMTLPCYQKQGYGRFLIDFSFLLSRRENLPGTPERPLSDLGRISYHSYWKSSVLEYLHRILSCGTVKKLSIRSIARGTGILVYDIVKVMEQLKMLKLHPQTKAVTIIVNRSLINRHMKEIEMKNCRIAIDESRLRWSPKVYSPSKDYALRSPSSMKKPAVNLKNSPSSRKDNPRVLFTETEKAGNVKSSRSSLNRRLFKNASKEANDAEFVRERKRKKSREDEVPSGRKHELLENEKTDDKTPSSKATCRDDFGKRRKRPHRRSSGDDDADDDGGNRKTENEANFTRRHSDAKGHRYSRVRAKERKSTSSFPSMRTTAVNERTGKVIARERLRRRAPPCNAFSDDSSDDENVPCVTRLSAVNRPSQRRTAPQKSPPSLIRKHHVGSASHRKFMSSRKKAITDISKSAEKRWTSRRHTPSSSSSASTVETVPMLDGEEVFRETSNTNHKLRLRNEVKKTQEADSIELNTNVVPHPNVLHDYPRSDDAHSESAAPTSLNSIYPVKSEASTSSGERSESDTESELSQHLTRRRRRVTKPRRKRSSVDLSSHINLQPCREGISSPLLTAERNSSASEDRCESVVEHPTRPESLTVNMGGDPDEVDESLAEEDQQSLSKCATKKLKTSETPPLLLANERCVAETDETTGKPVIMEVSGYKQNASPLMRYDDRKNSTYSSSGEMPRLRLSTVGGGGDIVNDDEDEEAPPRLSPNFASSELLDENSLSENDIAPELAETAGSPQPNRSKHAATYSESSDYVNTSVAEISRSSAQSVVQNPCEMVNVGGDAGSEGDSETGETGVTVPKKSEECSGNVCVTTTLEDEPSVLDRPPKAPAMLLQPAEDHDIHATPSYDQNLYLKGGREMLPGDSSTSYLETLQSSISPPSALSCASNISSKQSNVGSQEIAQHQQQMDTSVGGSDTSGTFLNTSGSLNSTPSTPIRLSNPQQGGQTSSNGGTNFGSPPGGQPVEMQIRVHNQRTVNSQLAASSVDIASAPSTLQRITRSPAHQSQRRNSGKKEHGRSTKSSTSSIPSRTHLSQMSSGQVPIAPYMLGAPGVPHTMTNPDITDSHSSQQAPGPYYHTNYSHAASSSHFDTQFYSAGWAGTGYPGSVASGYPSHMSAVAKTAMPNGFGYPYPSGILQPSNGMMGAIPIPNTASSASASVTCQVMNTQGNRMNTSHPGNPPAAWRYVSNPSTTLSGSGFMDAFSSGMTSSATGNQFPIPNQIYPQSYYPYLTPVMRNE